MKIQYASDLHLEFGKNSRYMRAHGLEPKGDILLLAGDVAYLENRRMEKDPFFDWCSTHYEETIIVPGNHEYYMDSIAREGHRNGIPLEKTLIDYEHKVRDNVRYLNNRSMMLDNDVEVFATTLWTVTEPKNYLNIQLCMNDCFQILYENHRLWSDEYAKVHRICRNWLDAALKRSSARHKIVLSHHCPTMRKEFISNQGGSGLHSAFHVDMESLIKQHDIEYWIYGHTHTEEGSGTVLPNHGGNGTTLLCNQLGYVERYGDIKGFRNDKCVTEE